MNKIKTIKPTDSEKEQGLNSLINQAKNGNTVVAAQLLILAADALNDNDVRGSVLRTYIQECLGKVLYEDFVIKPWRYHRDDKNRNKHKTQINKNKTFFFQAFNLAKKNNRPNDILKPMRDIEITSEYLILINGGKKKGEVIAELLERYWFDEKNGDNVGNEKTLRNIIKKNITIAMEFIKGRYQARYGGIKIFIKCVNNCVENNLYKDQKIECLLKKLCDKLHIEINKAILNDDLILETINEYLKQVCSNFPNEKLAISAIENVRKPFTLVHLQK